MSYPTNKDNPLEFVDYKKMVNTIQQTGHAAEFSLDVAEGPTETAPYVYTIVAMPFNGGAQTTVPAQIPANPVPTKRVQLKQADLQEFLEEYAEGKE